MDIREKTTNCRCDVCGMEVSRGFRAIHVPPGGIKLLVNDPICVCGGQYRPKAWFNFKTTAAKVAQEIRDSMSYKETIERRVRINMLTTIMRECFSDEIEAALENIKNESLEEECDPDE